MNTTTPARIVEVFGGTASESQPAKAVRHQRQIRLMQDWPELHAVLMESIGLSPNGQRLASGPPHVFTGTVVADHSEHIHHWRGGGGQDGT